MNFTVSNTVDNKHCSIFVHVYYHSYDYTLYNYYILHADHTCMYRIPQNTTVTMLTRHWKAKVHLHSLLGGWSVK